MTFLIRVTCPVCARDYRYSSDAPDEETRCPFSDCTLLGENTDEDDE